jgi:TP901 family phage tail tape measure protein
MAGSKTVSELKVRLSGDVQEALDAMGRVGDRAQKLGKRMRRTGFQLSRRLTAPLAAVGGASLKVAADFESSMNRVRGLTGATGDEFEALEEQAKQLGQTTAFSASEAADAMGFLGMAGFETNEIIGTMPDVLNLAAAAQMNLGEAADTVSNILTGYGMSVDELSSANDTLVKTTTSSNTNMQQLGAAFEQVGPIASDVGLEFEEVAAAIGVMGDAGVQAEKAGTALRVGLGRLINPTSQVQEGLAQLGLSAQDVNPQVNSLTEIIGTLEGAGADAGNILQIFGQRGAAIAPLIAQGETAIADLHDTVRDSSGAAEEMAEVQMEGLVGALKELKSAAEGLGIAIADSGLMGLFQGLIERLTGLLRAATEIEPIWLEMGAVFATVLASAGPLLIALGSMSSVLGLILSPAGAVVAALGALAAAGVAVARNWDGLRLTASEVWMGIKSVIFDAINGILRRLESLTSFVPKLGDKIAEVRRDFERWSEESLESSRQSIIEQEDALADLAREKGWLSDKTKELAQETDQQTKATDAARRATEQQTDALSDASDEADDLTESLDRLTFEQQKALQRFKDIGRDVGPSTEFERLVDTMEEGETQLRDVTDAAEESTEKAKDTGEELGQTFERELGRTIKNFESLGQAADRILSSITDKLLDLALNAAFSGDGSLSFLGDLFGGSRQHGGRVRPGRAFLVGEAGPELFVPDQPGRIEPGMAAAGSGVTVNVDARGAQDPAAVRQQVRRGIIEAAPAIEARAEQRVFNRLTRPRFA